MNRTMRMLASLSFVTGFGAAILLAAGSASAQVPMAGPPPGGFVPPPQPDLNLWVGRIGFGWYGTRSIPFVTSANATGITGIDTPLIGMRYWVNNQVGIDGALGFTHTSGSVTSGTTETNRGSATSFAIHLGVPIAIFNMTHYSFQITPELDFGLASGNNGAATAAAEIDYSGLLFQVGARAGAEVFFGFMGLPQLSLEASAGLYLASQSGKVSPQAPNSTETKFSQLTISTTQFHNPWDIFRESVAARYYF